MVNPVYGVYRIVRTTPCCWAGGFGSSGKGTGRRIQVDLPDLPLRAGGHGVHGLWPRAVWRLCRPRPVPLLQLPPSLCHCQAARRLTVMQLSKRKSTGFCTSGMYHTSVAIAEICTMRHIVVAGLPDAKPLRRWVRRHSHVCGLRLCTCGLRLWVVLIECDMSHMFVPESGNHGGPVSWRLKSRTSTIIACNKSSNLIRKR